jgi:uncharacterized membrane protein YfhO
VHQLERLPESAMIERLAEPDFDFRQTALVPPDTVQPPLALSAEDQIEIVAFEPDRLILSIEAGADGLLVVSEVDYPGWQVAVDGRPVPIMQVNGLLRAVPVPAGRHKIIFAFVSRSFQIGAGVSGATFLGLLLAAGGLMKKRGGSDHL